MLHHRCEAMFGLRGLSEGMQSQGHVRLCHLVQMIMQRLHEPLRLGAHAGIVPAQVRQHLRVHGLLADLLGSRLLHRALIELLVFVDQRVELAQLVVEPGGRKRGRLMADDHGTTPPACLDGLADVVLDIGVEHRQVTECEEGVVADGEAPILARQPFLSPMGAEVDQRIGSELLSQRLVGGEIEVIGRHLAVVVCLAWTTRTWRLRQQQYAAQTDCGYDEMGLSFDLPQRPVCGRITPALDQGPPAWLRQLREPT